MPRVKSETPVPYSATPAESDDSVIARALEILSRRVASGPAMDSPGTVRNYLRLQLGGLGHECFGVLFLDAQHQVIRFESMFRGTLSQTSVYPREVLKRCLELNAGAVILSHNHPSGNPSPSRADEHLTETLKAALAMVDVRILDHVIVTPTGSSSFAELGLL